MKRRSYFPEAWWPATAHGRLRLLVLACIVPSWLLAATVSWLSYQREKEAQVKTTAQTAQSLMHALERELNMQVAMLQTLAVSPNLDDRDLPRTHTQMQQIQQLASAFNLLWVDRDLQVMLASNRPLGGATPPLKTDRFPRTMSEGRPAVSNFFIGQVDVQPLVAVAAPVMREGHAVGRLEMIFAPRRFGDLIEQQKLPAGWTAAIIDEAGTIVARNAAPERFVGRPAPASLVRDMRRSPSGCDSARTVEGIEVTGCYHRSPAFGWTAVVGLPNDILAATLRLALLESTLGAIVLLCGGLALANRLGRSITQPIQALVAPALAIGRGEPADIASSGLRETNVLAGALRQAQALLRDRDQARQAAEISLQDSQSRLRMALDATRIGDWDLDLRTGVLQHSLRHDQCFGYSQPLAEWSTEHFLNHVHPEDRSGVAQRFSDALAGAGSWRLDCRVVWPDGSVHWIATRGAVLSDQGVAMRLLGIVIDITDRKRSEELRLHGLRLEAENRQILEATRLKSEFVANMSHELRTPLNAIIGFADILRTPGAPADASKCQEFLGHIANSGRHLLQLINDVLDLSKVEAGKLDFYPEHINLPKLVHDVLAVLHPESHRKRIRCATQLDPELTDLHLDPGRLKQVLYNFLSNAIKFTAPGGHVTLRTLAVGRQHVRIEVEDTGIGIAAQDQAKLFAPFQQVNTGYAKQHQGTGLGLALTRRLAELQCGSVGVSSVPGVGSVFHVVLPRHAHHGPDHAAEAASGLGADARSVSRSDWLQQPSPCAPACR